ncbi:hypothetical protein BGX27_009438 [Mortierella sp. AM989]|nr:hypothetical protein BGX27_009438 [Mortierella sp. AM989]
MHSDENRGVSCTQRQQQQQQQPQRHANNIHIPLTAASNAGLSSETMSSSSSVVDPLANNPYRDEEKEHYSSSCMLDSVNLHFASMDINDRDSTPDLELSTLCDSNLQSASAGVAAVSDIDGDDVLELGCLDESLLKALKDPQQRLFLLDLDSKFCNFIGNTSPVLRFFHLVEEEEEEEEAAQEQHEIEVVNPIRVLKRCPTRSTNNPCGEGCNNDSTLTSRSTRTIPMEDREKSYAEARARIFQGDTNCDDNHTLSDHESESTEETVDDHPLPANIKTPSVRARQSLHTLLDDTDHSMQQQNKMRSRSLARSASTSSTASSSSGTAMTDISNRSDSTTSSEFHSPGSASGNPSSYCYGSRSTTGYSSAPGYDYFGRNRSSGSMDTNTISTIVHLGLVYLLDMIVLRHINKIMSMSISDLKILLHIVVNHIALMEEYIFSKDQSKKSKIIIRKTDKGDWNMRGMEEEESLLMQWL